MKKPANRGFTLVELLVVVAILGVLATLAVAIPSHYLRQARQSEAKGFLGNIAVRQENNRAQFGTYRSAPANPATVPTSGDRLPWDESLTDWKRLGAHPRQAVLYFQYQVVSGSGVDCTAMPACAGVTKKTWWYATAVNSDATVYINSANLEPRVIETR